MPRKPKYDTVQIETWKCGKCEHVWYYQTLKCPICTSLDLLRIN